MPAMLLSGQPAALPDLLYRENIRDAGFSAAPIKCAQPVSHCRDLPSRRQITKKRREDIALEPMNDALRDGLRNIILPSRVAIIKAGLLKPRGRGKPLQAHPFITIGPKQVERCLIELFVANHSMGHRYLCLEFRTFGRD